MSDSEKKPKRTVYKHLVEVKTGPKKKATDWEQFENLCHIHCTQEEIASILKYSVDTLERRVFEKYGEKFAEVYKRFSANGKSSLRRTQFKLAQKNAALAIWLGKQWLDQKENATVTVVPEEVKEKFDDVMTMVKDLQEQRKTDATNDNNVT